MSAATQTAFAAGLFAATPPPAGLTAWNSPAPERRYGVYRNNVSASLTGALSSRFPVAERIVGAEFFRAMAQAFVRLHPPRSPLLLAYGDDFPNFVAAFEPARDIAYLPDVMRLEVARGRAYHAADAAPLDPQALAAVDPARLGDLVFTPHPALSIFSSPHPSVTIWAMNAGERPLAPLDHWEGEDALVVRPQMIVEVIALPPGGAMFHSLLAAGETLGLAAEAAMAADERFDLSTNLAVLLRSGAFTAIREENPDEHRHDA
ncbi:HvfC/BufC N-terminal domain-containing protein [Shinella sp.]|uniref:HvfC/BufC N-terminal domain-containing protein n=1 Tax=Shinella sp. TaxID=1870904 RepID=UPI003F6F8508